MYNKTALSIFVVVVFIFGGLLYIYNPTPVEYKNPKEKKEIICTTDAKLCPNGSYVGRTGPNCEFICPIPPDVQMEDGTVEQAQ